MGKTAAKSAVKSNRRMHKLVGLALAIVVAVVLFIFVAKLTANPDTGPLTHLEGYALFVHANGGAHYDDRLSTPGVMSVYVTAEAQHTADRLPVELFSGLAGFHGWTKDAATTDSSLYLTNLPVEGFHVFQGHVPEHTLFIYGEGVRDLPGLHSADTIGVLNIEYLSIWHTPGRDQRDELLIRSIAQAFCLGATVNDETQDGQCNVDAANVMLGYFGYPRTEISKLGEMGTVLGESVAYEQRAALFDFGWSINGTGEPNPR